LTVGSIFLFLYFTIYFFKGPLEGLFKQTKTEILTGFVDTNNQIDADRQNEITSNQFTQPTPQPIAINRNTKTFGRNNRIPEPRFFGRTKIKSDSISKQPSLRRKNSLEIHIGSKSSRPLIRGSLHAKRLNADLFSSAEAAAFKNPASADSRDSFSETVRFLSFSFIGMISETHIFSPIKVTTFI